MITSGVETVLAFSSILLSDYIIPKPVLEPFHTIGEDTVVVGSVKDDSFGENI